jgi:hypothetical protein
MQALPGQEAPDGVPNFKMVLVGDGGTGAISELSLVGCSIQLIRKWMHLCVRDHWAGIVGNPLAYAWFVYLHMSRRLSVASLRSHQPLHLTRECCCISMRSERLVHFR